MQSSVTDTKNTTDMSCTCGRYIDASEEEIFKARVNEYFDGLFGPLKKQPVINLPYHDVTININTTNDITNTNNTRNDIVDDTVNNVSDSEADTNKTNVSSQNQISPLPDDVSRYAINYNILRILLTDLPPLTYKK